MSGFKLKEFDLFLHIQTFKVLVGHLGSRGKRLLCWRLLLTAFIAILGFTYDWVFGLLIQGGTEIFNTGLIPSYVWLLFTGVLLVSFLETTMPQFDGHNWRTLSAQILERYEFLVASQRARLDVAVDDDPELKDYIHRSTDSIYRVSEFLHHCTRLSYGLVSFIVASSIIMSFYWWIFLLILICTLPELIVGMKRGQVIWSIYQVEGERRRRFWEYRTYLHKSASIRDIKLLRASKYFLEQFISLFSDFKNKELRAELRFTIWLVLASLVSFVGVAFALTHFVKEIAGGGLEIAQFVFVFGAVLRFRATSEDLFYQLASMNSDGIFVSELHEFLNIQPVIQDKEDALTLKPNLTPNIVFEDVWFRYRENQDWVLKGISFEINPGEKLAIIGDNGAGKTTLVKLLCRFYDPSKGRILVDGTDLKLIKTNNWWEKLGCLFQDFEHYFLKAKDAIALGDIHSDFDFEKVKQAGKKAGVDQMMSKWNDGWDQLIGRGYSDGVELSAGEHQRLALARLFYRDPRIMLLDEPTSWVDVPTEGKIFKELKALPEDRSLIFVSHRFSTVRQADEIILIKDGVIAEQGSHDQLLRENGDYASRFYEEAQHYKDE